MKEAFAGLKREIDQIAKDKGMDKQVVIGAIEEAMRQAARRKFGQEREIEARFNEELGEIEIFEFREVVEQVIDETSQVDLPRARTLDPGAELGDDIGVKLDTKDFGRILAQTATLVRNPASRAMPRISTVRSEISFTSASNKRRTKFG